LAASPLTQSPFLRLSYHLQLRRNFSSFRLMHINPPTQPSPLMAVVLLRPTLFSSYPPTPVSDFQRTTATLTAPAQRPGCPLHPTPTPKTCCQPPAHPHSTHEGHYSKPQPRSSPAAARYADAIRSHSAVAPATPITSAVRPRFSLPAPRSTARTGPPARQPR
jgi:hypothetical protein